MPRHIDWKSAEGELRRLYVNEKMTVDQIRDYMKANHQFEASKSAFRLHFRQTGLNALRPVPYIKNQELLARTKEMWENNMPQREILKRLIEEGFDITDGRLRRLRTENKMLLRQSYREEGGTMLGPVGDEPGEFEAGGERPLKMTERQHPTSTFNQQMAGSSPQTPQEEAWGSNASWHDIHPMAEDYPYEVDNEPQQRDKKKRRRDLIRYPSETTLAQAKAILSLDTELYNHVRATFKTICEEAGFIKKTMAGPERWEAAKDQLILRIPHLQVVMWPKKEDLAGKKIALDVLCCDVTKHMRQSQSYHRMSLSTARNALGLNPKQARELNAAFRAVLLRDGFTHKGRDRSHVARWERLKREWMDENDLLRDTLAPAAYAGSQQQSAQKLKAIEALTSDVLKRMQLERTRGGMRLGDHDEPSALVDGDADGDADDETDEESPQLPRDQSGFDATEGPRGPAATDEALPSPHKDQTVSPRRPRPQKISQRPPREEKARSARANGSHTRYHAGDPVIIDPPVTPQAALGPESQFLPHFAMLPTGDVPARRSAAHAVYLRLDPDSYEAANGAPGMCIATLSSSSMIALQQAIIDKFKLHNRSSAAAGVAIEGIIPDGGGGEIPLHISDDTELCAYLAHVRDQGVRSPIFHVRILQC